MIKISKDTHNFKNDELYNQVKDRPLIGNSNKITKQQYIQQINEVINSLAEEDLVTLQFMLNITIDNNTVVYH